MAEAATGGVAGAAERTRSVDWARLLRWALAVAVVVPVLYFGVTFVQVWWTSRHDGARPAQAVIVLGAAQYDGRPSPVLRARLDHAADLWHRKIAPVVVVTGGKADGDRFTESQAGANLPPHQGHPRRRHPPGGHRADVVAVAGRLGPVPAPAGDPRRRPRLRPLPRRPHPRHRRRARPRRRHLADPHQPDQGAVGAPPHGHRDRPGRRRPGDRVPPARPGRAALRRRPAGGPGAPGALSSGAPVRGWCNRQHCRFWPCHSGFESLPPSSKQHG